MKTQHINNQQAFRATWFHLPVGETSGYFLPQDEIDDIKAHLTDSFTAGHVKHIQGDVGLKIYQKSALFELHNAPVVLANNPIPLEQIQKLLENKSATAKIRRQLSNWAIFLKNQCVPEGITAVFRNPKGIKDKEFDILARWLLKVLKREK